MNQASSYRHAYCLPASFAVVCLMLFAVHQTAQAQAEAVPHPNQNQNVLEAKRAYEEAKANVKATQKEVTLARLALQKLIKSSKTAGKAEAAAAEKESSPLGEAEKIYSDKQAELAALKSKLLVEANDPKHNRLTGEIKSIDAAIKKAQSKGTPGEINKQFISLSQQLSSTRRELSAHEKEMLSKNAKYAKMSKELDQIKAMVFSLKRELALQRKNGTATSGKSESPEIESGKQAVADATETYGAAVKAQKQAKRDYEIAIATAQKEYAAYLYQKKQDEIQAAVEAAQAAREARRARDNRRDRRSR